MLRSGDRLSPAANRPNRPNCAPRPASPGSGREQGERPKAYDLLAPVYGWFTEGFDTADLKEAKALLVHRGVQKIHPVGVPVWLAPRKWGVRRQRRMNFLSAPVHSTRWRDLI